MRQKTLTFSKQKYQLYREGYLPIGHITIEDEFKESMVKKGYVVRNVRRAAAIIADVARANVPLGERKRMQAEIDKTNPIHNDN